MYVYIPIYVPLLRAMEKSNNTEKSLEGLAAIESLSLITLTKEEYVGVPILVFLSYTKVFSHSTQTNEYSCSI